MYRVKYQTPTGFKDAGEFETFDEANAECARLLESHPESCPVITGEPSPVTGLAVIGGIVVCMALVGYGVFRLLKPYLTTFNP